MQYPKILVDQFGIVVWHEGGPGGHIPPTAAHPYSQLITINTADRDWQVGQHYGSPVSPA